MEMKMKDKCNGVEHIKVGDIVKIPYPLTKTVHTTEEIVTAQTVENPVGEVISIQTNGRESMCEVKINECFGTVWFTENYLLKLKGEEMRFKDFGIKQPCFIGSPPTEDYYKYNFDVVKYYIRDDKELNYTIGSLHWDKREFGFRFESCGLRYLQDRENGLEEWLLKWCEMKKVEYEYEED